MKRLKQKFRGEYFLCLRKRDLHNCSCSRSISSSTATLLSFPSGALPVQFHHRRRAPSRLHSRVAVVFSGLMVYWRLGLPYIFTIVFLSRLCCQFLFPFVLLDYPKIFDHTLSYSWSSVSLIVYLGGHCYFLLFVHLCFF